MPYIGNPIYQSAFVTDTFSGNGTTTAFTMSVAPAGTTNVLVAISGVLQDPSTYGVVGTTITFSSAPPSGTGNISCRYLGIPVTGVTTTAYRTVTEFTATAGQTTFTPPSYTVGFINVYRNGVLLGSTDYTATNGTTVVLASGATSGDLVTVESFLVSSVLNAIPNTRNSVAWTNLPTGSVLQVVQGTTSTTTSSTNTTYVDTTLTASITPKFSNSKILVLVSQATTISQAGLVYYGDIKLVRNSTTIYSGTSVGGYLTNNVLNVSGTSATSGQNTFMFNVQYLDSPATTSATTYKTQQATPAAAYTIATQNFSPSFITLLEIAG